MTTFDFSPLYSSSIGFDRLAGLMDAATRGERAQTAYPPYNIEKVEENNYRITMAVAGFAEADLSLEVHNNQMLVKGRKTPSDEQRTYLHQGIAERAFEHRFQLADYVRVKEANLENGLLHVELVRELPDEMKPRNIAIKTGGFSQIRSEEKAA